MIHPITMHHDLPLVGMPARIVRIGSTDVDNSRWYMNDPSNFNLSVSGEISVDTVVNAEEFYGPTTLASDFVGSQMVSSGRNPGIRKVELWLRPDGGDASSAILLDQIRTDATVPAPQFINRFSFDSTEFPNATYELTILAEDARGVFSIPPFGSAGTQAGTPEALNGFYFPIHVTINN